MSSSIQHYPGFFLVLEALLAIAALKEMLEARQ
jgi:hypothetical protein